MKLEIKSRVSEAKFEGEFSSFEYHITASRKIIQEIDDARIAIEAKYPKVWDKEVGK